jgi:NADPH-dependent curcumin reductase CurA
LPPGELASGVFGWQDYAASDGGDGDFPVTKVPPGVDLPTALSLLGVTGLTAHIGLIDYKGEDVEARLGELCSDGVEVFFDNVGGETLDAVLENIARSVRASSSAAPSRARTTTGSATTTG